jgi:hypothetical protein
MARGQNNKYGSSYRKRIDGGVTPSVRFLIVCEGERTEPKYFKGFPLVTADVEIIGEGYNTVSLINRVISLRKELGFLNKTDYVWCVFDKDDYSDNNFNAAIHKAEANGINVAYSNEAFELWYLLHFDRHDSALHREQYIDKLSENLKFRYTKNYNEMYSLLIDNQPIAIKRAKELYQKRSSSPANDNPSTTVFKLVEELNKYINDGKSSHCQI